VKIPLVLRNIFWLPLYCYLLLRRHFLQRAVHKLMLKHRDLQREVLRREETWRERR
jgi:hypothetical protein